MTIKIKELPPRHERAIIQLIGKGKPLGLARAKALREVEVIAPTKRRRAA